MSTCGNCDCVDKSQCVKKYNNNYGIIIVDKEERYVKEEAETAGIGENDGNCKCASNCTCPGCNCGK